MLSERPRGKLNICHVMPENQIFVKSLFPSIISTTMMKSWVSSVHKKILADNKKAYLEASGDARKAILTKIKSCIRESGGKRVPKKHTRVILHVKCFNKCLMGWISRLLMNGMTRRRRGAMKMQSMRAIIGRPDGHWGKWLWWRWGMKLMQGFMLPLAASSIFVVMEGP